MIRDEKSNFSATGDGSFQLSRALALLGEEQKKTEKKQKELEQEREKKRKELAVKEEMLGEEIRQQQEKLCEKKAEMELCRKNILEKKLFCRREDSLKTQNRNPACSMKKDSGIR